MDALQPLSPGATRGNAPFPGSLTIAPAYRYGSGCRRTLTPSTSPLVPVYERQDLDCGTCLGLRHRDDATSGTDRHARICRRALTPQYTIRQPVGADSSRPPPIYRPAKPYPINFLNPFIGLRNFFIHLDLPYDLSTLTRLLEYQ